MQQALSMTGSAKTEASLERSLLRKAKELGWLIRKVQWIGRSGAPDRLFVRNGQVVFIELKREGGWLRQEQWREARALRAQGVVVRAADTLSDALKVLDNPNAPPTACETRTEEKWRL